MSTSDGLRRQGLGDRRLKLKLLCTLGLCIPTSSVKLVDLLGTSGGHGRIGEWAWENYEAD